MTLLDKFKLYEYIYDSGLIQFGTFYTPNEMPMQARIDWLSSYPQLINELSSHITHSFASEFDREKHSHVACTHEITNLAQLIASEYSLPLIYSRGRGEPVIQDLVGAYDVGHDTILITGETSKKQIEQFIQSASRVGLSIKNVISFFNVGSLSVPMYPILDLPDMLDYFTSMDWMPSNKASQVASWWKNCN